MNLVWRVCGEWIEVRVMEGKKKLVAQSMIK